MAIQKISSKLLTLGIISHVLTKGGLFLAFFLCWGAAQEEFLQTRSWGIAKDISARLEPHLSKEIDQLAALRESMHFLQYMPTMEILIVDAQGKIILSYSVTESDNTRTGTVDMAPIYRFLDDPEGISIPIRGTDPDGGSGVVFSAAPIRVKGTAHYVYTILENSHGRRVSGLLQSPLAFRSALLTTIILVLVGVGTERLLISRSLKRFDGIVAKVTNVTAGEFDGSAPEGGNDELATLGRSINTMSTTISSHLDSLRERDQRRRELIANIWHDIRTPIAGVGALVQSLERQGANGGGATSSIVHRLSANVDLLTRILSELQELGKLETGDIMPQCAPCSAVEIADEMILIYRELASEKGLSFIAKIPETLPEINADFTMIARVLSNLIENALRYTPQGGTIELALQEIPGHGVQFAVTDTGPGIESFEMSKIFERDYQVEGHQNGLAGLGLAIVKKIIEHHGSEIRVESKSGQGASFSFILPGNGFENETPVDLPRPGSRSQTLILDRADLTVTARSELSHD